MTKGKKSLIIIAIILAIPMVAMCVAWLCIYFFAPDKMVFNTYNVGTLTTADGSITKNIIEVHYNANANHDGLEMLEIKFNDYVDETQQNIYSQGLQFVANSRYDTLSFEFMLDDEFERQEISSERNFLRTTTEYNQLGTYILQDGATKYNYQSFNDFETTSGASYELNYDSKLRIQIGEDIYAMKFKGKNTPTTSNNFEIKTTSTGLFQRDIVNYYSYYGFDYFAKLIYDAVKPMAYGTNQTCVWKFGDLFDYYKYNGSTYDENAISQVESSKVIEEVLNYYAIKVTIEESGAKSADDSIFGCVHNSTTFVLDQTATNDDLFVGRSRIDVGLSAFELIPVLDNNVALKLKDSFVNQYKPYANKIILDVRIDLDELKKLGYIYFGLANDHGLDNFITKSVVTIETIDGHTVETEVKL